MEEKAEKNKYPAFEIYTSAVRDVCKNVCEQNQRPICARYEEAVAEKLNEVYGYTSNEQKMTSKGVHGNVYRALQTLVKKTDLISFGKLYFPNTEEYRRKGYGLLIKQHIRFLREDIHKVSSNTCIIPLEKAPDDSESVSSEEIISLFKNYVEEKYCYDIRIVDNLIVVMLCGDDSETMSIIEQIAQLVKEIYKQQKPSKIKISHTSK